MSTNRHPGIIGAALGTEKDLTPEQVVTHGQWSDQEKLDRLERMKTDAMAKQRADKQGQDPDESHPDLRAIERAISAVKNDQHSLHPDAKIRAM